MKREMLVLVFALMLAPALAPAQESIDASRRNAIVRAIEKAAPAVVTVNVVDVRTERVYEPLLHDFFRDFGFIAPAPRVRRRAVESMGTGFFFDAEGHILTNYHVVQNADYGMVTLPDGREIKLEGIVI